MREGFSTAAVILLWLVVSTIFYFWVSATIWGLLAGLAVLIVVPIYSIFFDR